MEITSKTYLFIFFMRHKIITGLAIVVLIGIAGSTGSNTPTKVDSASTAPIASKDTTSKQTPAPTKPSVPTEYISALAKAQTYGDTMQMSKAGIYDQLTSENGEKFSKESAQYAVDNVKVDWKENALKKAQTYQKDMSMSPSAVYDQLISKNGEKFTPSEAQYAKDNLK